MTLKRLLILSGAGGLALLLVAAFAFSLYDVVAGDPGGGAAQRGAVRELEFSDTAIAPDSGIGVGSALQPVVRSDPPCLPQGPPPGRPGRPPGPPPYGPPCPIYPSVVASATCQVTRHALSQGQR